MFTSIFSNASFTAAITLSISVELVAVPTTRAAAKTASLVAITVASSDTTSFINSICRISWFTTGAPAATPAATPAAAPSITPETTPASIAAWTADIFDTFIGSKSDLFCT